ncbi:NACHT family NTPase fused to HEAT repeats domain [Halapricum desulfuricans]|uniref:NACHT family NTPase fused to HEAT repeats domain n=1 Tax=Halapricum desulfuricans TaxID=2841257 RepID=A0A897NEU9_9EURY|nr:HEAT repeat domain-containing protein [Halapricum desulfuricans]QSG12950.1 NACHT family NTPase fused to HEAT repeats domain [Halapricum desulfuricans]
MQDESDRSERRHAPPDPAEITAALAAEDPTRRREAIDAFGRLVRSDVDSAAEHAGAVARQLDDESRVVARGAAEVLVPVADEHPDTLLGELDRVVALLAADTVDLSVAGARLLSPLGVDRPQAVARHTDRLLEILIDDAVPKPEAAVPESVDRVGTRQMVRSVQQESLKRRRYVRQTIANVIVAAAESDPTSIDDVAGLEALLDDPDPGVVGPALDALGNIAQADADRTRQTLDSVLACVEHENTQVRARAVRTLGYMGAESAVQTLERVAVEDDEEAVRELAAETATFLSGE